MSGDFSRLTFNQAKHFSGVRMQQGRLQIDADWNEQMDILTHRMETEVSDFLGLNGVPMSVNGGRGFAITVNNGIIQLGAGRYYIAGRLFENEQDYMTIASDLLPSANGAYVAYLDTWQRHITAAQDPSIVEVALGGPDTATRIKNEWQVRFEQTQADPIALRKSWQPVIAPISSGLMNARLNTQAFSLENQLYRIEIHAVDTNGLIQSFKWSRDNGSIMAAVVPPVDMEGRVVGVTSIGRDDLQSFQANQWIELTTKAQTNQGQAGILVQIQHIIGNRIIVTEASWAAARTIWNTNRVAASDIDLVRRWDMPDGLIQATSDSWQLIEQGIEVLFQAGKQYKPGDYWLIPSRAATGSIEWPTEGGQSIAQPAHGIRHTFVPLALLQLTSKQWSLATDGDLRTTFRPMVNGLVNKSGDTMTGPLRIADALEVTGPTTLNGNVTVGAANTTSALVVNSPTTLNNNVTISAVSAKVALTVKGMASLDVVTVTGHTNLNTLQVNGSSPTNFVGGVQVGGPAYLTNSLTVKGTSNLLGDLTITGKVSIGTSNVSIGTTIELSGSEYDSPLGDTPFIKMNGIIQPFTVTVARGLNTMILSPEGIVIASANHDVWGKAENWNVWEKWIQEKATDGQVVAVVSKDAVSKLPDSSKAGELLKSIGASAFRSILGTEGDTSHLDTVRVPYALAFIKGATGKAKEALGAHTSGYAQVFTTYQSLQNSEPSNNLRLGAEAYFGGNVGIGTTTPGAKLDIVGNIRLTGLINGPSTRPLQQQMVGRRLFSEVKGVSRSAGGNFIHIGEANTDLVFCPKLQQGATRKARFFVVFSAINTSGKYQIVVGGDAKTDSLFSKGEVQSDINLVSYAKVNVDTPFWEFMSDWMYISPPTTKIHYIGIYSTKGYVLESLELQVWDSFDS